MQENHLLIEFSKFCFIIALMPGRRRRRRSKPKPINTNLKPKLLIIFISNNI